MRVNSLPSPSFPSPLCLLHRTRLKAETRSKNDASVGKGWSEIKASQPGARQHNLHVPRNSATPPASWQDCQLQAGLRDPPLKTEGESDSRKKARQCETLQELIKKKKKTNKQTRATETGITVASSEASWGPAQGLRKTHCKAFPRISSAKNLCSAPGHAWGR